MSEPEGTPSSVRWARLRYSVVSSLLTSPPEHGELQERIAALAARKWTHPSTGEPAVFDFKTIERWYYVARAHAPQGRPPRPPVKPQSSVAVHIGETVFTVPIRDVVPKYWSV